MPEPTADETQDEFISRCMADEESMTDFPDQDQRLAFCFSTWNEFVEQFSLRQNPIPGENMERRFVPLEKLELRQDDDGAMSISGMAAVIGQESEDLGGFTEIIEEGAFDAAIEASDVRALYNHDSNYLLGRTASGTLRIEARSDGLFYEVPDLPPSRRDVYELIERGDVTGNSFAFTVEEDRWEQRDDGRQVRYITQVRELFDVGPVVYPAYSQTVVSARALERAKASAPEARNDHPRVKHAKRRVELEDQMP